MSCQVVENEDFDYFLRRFFSWCVQKQQVQNDSSSRVVLAGSLKATVLPYCLMPRRLLVESKGVFCFVVSSNFLMYQ